MNEDFDRQTDGSLAIGCMYAIILSGLLWFGIGTVVYAVWRLWYLIPIRW